MNPELQAFADRAKDIVMQIEINPEEKIKIREIFELYLLASELGGIKSFPIRIKFDMEYIHTKLVEKIPLTLNGFALICVAKELYKRAKSGEIVTTNEDVKSFITETAEISLYIDKMLRTNPDFCYNDIERFKQLELLYMSYCKESQNELEPLNDVYMGIYVHIINAS